MPVLAGLVSCALLIGAALVVSSPPKGEPDPTADELRRMIGQIGGLRATSLGTAVGAFDLVTFDPREPDRLSAVHRDGYGPAQNQSVNELWEIDAGLVTQRPWAARTPHDFAHLNQDGTITMWVHGGGAGFAPRVPAIVDGDGRVATLPSAIHASRSATAGGAVFALTGLPDYYGSTEPYRELVAVTHDGMTRLASGEGFAWINAPTEDLVIASPVDGMTALGVRFDGRMEVIDLRTAAVTDVFGSFDPAPVDRPVELDHDGRVAVTVDSAGDVGVWLVGDDEPLAVVDGDIAITRWLHERRASRPASAITPDASRWRCGWERGRGWRSAGRSSRWERLPGGAPHGAGRDWEGRPSRERI